MIVLGDRNSLAELGPLAARIRAVQGELTRSDERIATWLCLTEAAIVANDRTAWAKAHR